MDRIVFITPNFAVTGQLAPEDFAKAAAGGLTKEAFRKYYALRASSNVSRGGRQGDSFAPP